MVAMTYYDKALKLDPYNIHILIDKGTALYTLGNYSGSIIYFDEALKIDPYHVNALSNKGLALDSLGNYSES